MVKGARVKFEVEQGGGVFQNELPTFEALTDSDGRASAHLKLGGVTGLDKQTVQATLIDASQGKLITAGFSASGFEAKDPADTVISGLVFDNQDNPLPNVTVRVDGTTRQAVTDSYGIFKITQAPVGPVHLVVDGSTTTASGEYPSLSYNIVTISGVDNPLPAPVFMVKLNTDNAIMAGTQDVEITVPEVPGFKLEVAAGSVTFPDGSKQGMMSVTPVNAAKIPMTPPNGIQPQFIVTIQPTGAKFDPPARLTIPNVDGHKPGAQIEMFSYDHDLEEFVAIGLGTVNTEGTLLESNPGVGVIKAGWHLASPPDDEGCTTGPSQCSDYCSDPIPGCDAGCELVPTRRSLNQNPNDCKDINCDGGVVAADDPLVDTNPADCKTPACDGFNHTTVLAPNQFDPALDADKNDCATPVCQGNPDGSNSSISWMFAPDQAPDDVNYNCSATMCVDITGVGGRPVTQSTVGEGVRYYDAGDHRPDVTKEACKTTAWKCKQITDELGEEFESIEILNNVPPQAGVNADNKCWNCANGVEEAVPLTYPDWQSTVAQPVVYPKLDKIYDAVKLFNKIPKLTVTVEPVVTLQSVSKYKSCCSASSGQIDKGETENVSEVSAGLRAKFNVTPLIPIVGKNVGFDVPGFGWVKMELDIDVGVFLSGTASVKGIVGQRDNQCEDKNCPVYSLAVVSDLGIRGQVDLLTCASGGGLFLPDFSECNLFDISLEGAFRLRWGYEENMSFCGDGGIPSGGYDGVYVTLTAMIDMDSINLKGYRYKRSFGPFFKE